MKYDLAITKKLLMMLLVILPILCWSQKIRSETDKFTKMVRNETDNITIYGAYMAFIPNRIEVNLRSVDTACFIMLYGYNTAAGVIGSGDDLIFLLEDGKTVTVKSTGIQDYTIDGSVKVYHHQYYINRNSIELFSKGKVKSMRIYYNQIYKDIDIKDKNADSFTHLCSLFYNVVAKK